MAEEFRRETRYDKREQRRILDLASRIAAEDAKKATIADLVRRGEEQGLRADQVHRAIVAYETRRSRGLFERLKKLTSPIRFLFRGLSWAGRRGRGMVNSAYQFEKKPQS